MIAIEDIKNIFTIFLFFILLNYKALDWPFNQMIITVKASMFEIK